MNTIHNSTEKQKQPLDWNSYKDKQPYAGKDLVCVCLHVCNAILASIHNRSTSVFLTFKLHAIKTDKLSID